MTRVSVAAVLGCVVATIGLFGQQPATLQPDQIFYNGKIVTVDPVNSTHEAFAVKGDRFLAVGTSAAIRAMGGPQTVMVDFNGRRVVPGLTDSHAHPWRNAFRNLRGSTSPASRRSQSWPSGFEVLPRRRLGIELSM